MKKKMISILLMAAFVCSALIGCGNNGDSDQSSTDAVTNKGGNKEYDLTLYTVNSTDADFGDWLANVEGAKPL